MKKWIAGLLVWILAASLAAWPAGAEGVYATARTPVSSASEDQLTNIRLASASVDQLYVESGARFSFNETVGPRTAENGYVKAINGRGADVRGGGVAQVATTLYLAVRDLDCVDVDDFDTYGSRFTGDYVADGDLAVITDYEADHDFSFVNNTGGELLLEMWLSDSFLYCTVTQEASGMEFTTATDSWFTSTAPDASRSSRLVASAWLHFDGDDALRNNVSLCAGSIYDTTLAYGDEFSFNAVVGPREERYGYETAINGRGVKVVGGGVAQVASVVWLAIEDLDDVSIVEKSTYGKRYNQDYVDSSADAILTDYNAGTDFAFRYVGDDSITLYTYLDGDTLHCDVYANN